MTKEQLFEIVDNVVKNLIKYNPKIIVCACNTATAMVLNDIRAKYKDYTFVGTEPAIKVVHDNFNDKNTIILTTKGTGHSEKFQELLKQYMADYRNSDPLGLNLTEEQKKWLPFIERINLSTKEVKSYYNMIKNAIMENAGIQNKITKRFSYNK